MSTARDERVLADIVENIPGVTDPVAVRSLLGAWWEHAGRQASAGRVADSGIFIADRQAAGLLELPPDLAERVIEREFALLHAGAGTQALSAATRAAELGQGAAAARPRPTTAAPPARAAARLEALVGAGLVVVGSLLVGPALLLGEQVDHLALPGGRATGFVTPWKAWLAVLAGGFGALLAVAHQARRPGAGAAVRAPGVALGGLAAIGLGLLAGSVAVTAVGGVVFGVVGAVAVVTRR